MQNSKLYSDRHAKGVGNLEQGQQNHRQPIGEPLDNIGRIYEFLYIKARSFPGCSVKQYLIYLA
ncbi:hypothetical protein IQ225_18455 [Synechocystis salina LEGE 06155]|uniref:hypothetical protein n=1 Tax=Synechocystis sp. LEGE 06083 TaxID=915336 RepID=UPI0018815274|nr:hypothetical protein [Synechocystis sp. LEGE 06083]MBE9176807.1 hypothetical protein [Synechocystis salina LEGE 06155]